MTPLLQRRPGRPRPHSRPLRPPRLAPFSSSFPSQFLPRSRIRARQVGSTSVFAVCVVSVLMLLAGLCIDGGRVLNARTTLTDEAEQAARAGAQEVQIGGIRRTNEVVLDPAAARAAAREYLAAAGDADAASATVTTAGNTVTVTAETDAPTFMLSLVGVSTVHITVVGSAQAESGII